MIARQVTRRMLSSAFSRIPVPLLTSVTQAPPLVAYYHMVSDGHVPHVKHLYGYKSVQQFSDDLDFLCRHYQPIGLQELLESVRAGRSRPRTLLLTFDDGFREMHDIVAPMLLAKGVPATFFLNSDFIDNARLCYLNKASLLVDVLRKRRSRALDEAVSAVLLKRLRFENVESGILAVKYADRDLLDEAAVVAGVDFNEYLRTTRPYLTEAQVRSLAQQGFTFGGHSVDHPLYALLPLEEQVSQTLLSMKDVRSRFGLQYGAFAFPHGDSRVSRDYFARVSASGLVDVSFGTAGLLRDCVPWHLQRISLEAPLEPARDILAFQYARRLAKVMTSRATIARD